jgi:DNA-binding response OmpR family regulator
MGRILIVEDDRDIAELLGLYLTQAGHAVTVLPTGAGAPEWVAREAPDVVILDRMLPGLDGLDVCRRLRANPGTAAVPIVMLTARAEEADRIAGLETGADDYVTKPFSPKEVVARVHALLRRVRRSAPSKPLLVYGPVRLDSERHRVTLDGHEIRLTAKEYGLLRYFLEHRGRVLSRDILLTDVWGYQYTGGTRTVDVHVRRLREKIPLLVEAITTVKQFGYRLDERAPE